MTVLLHVEEDGAISTPYGTVGDLEPCVLISEQILEWTRHGDRPLCRRARELLRLGAMGSARTEGDVMTVDVGKRELRYRIYEAEWDDGHGRMSAEKLYLGVLDVPSEHESC